MQISGKNSESKSNVYEKVLWILSFGINLTSLKMYKINAHIIKGRRASSQTWLKGYNEQLWKYVIREIN